MDAIIYGVGVFTFVMLAYVLIACIAYAGLFRRALLGAGWELALRWPYTVPLFVYLYIRECRKERARRMGEER